MTSRDLFELEHGDTGVALLVKVKAEVAHSGRDKSEQPTAEPHKSLPDVRLKRLLGLSRWERAGALTYILATHPEVFDEAYDALGFKVE